MKKVIALVFFLAGFSFLAQNKLLDSLWKDYKKTNQADTSRLKTFNNIAFNYSLINADSGRILALQLIKETQTKQFKKIESSAYNSLGINYMNMDSSEKAISTFNISYSISEKLNDKSKMAVALMNIGLVYDNLSEYLKALDYKLKALKLFEESNDKKGLANAYANIGNGYKFLSNATKAIEYYLKSLKTAEETGNKNLQANNLNNIGLVYSEIRDYKRALNYLEKSIKLKEETGNKRGLNTSLTNAAQALFDLKRYEESLQYMLRVYELQKQLGNSLGIAHALHAIGFYYNNLPVTECERINLSNTERIKKSIDYNLQAMKISESIGEKRLMSKCLTNIGSAYYSLAKYEESEKFLTRALKIIKEIAALSDEGFIQLSLSETYEKLGKKGEALAALKRSMALQDSLQNQALHDEIARTEIQYEYNKKAAADSIKNAEAQKVKDAEIKVQSSQLKQERTQRFALYGGLFLILCFAVFAYSRFKITQKQKGIIELQKYEVEKQKALVEEKQKEVMDSIRYAKRIQNSLLPSEKYIARNLKKKE